MTGPDAHASKAWLAAHAVVEAAIAWAEAVEDEDAGGADLALEGLRKAVGTYSKVRKFAVAAPTGGAQELLEFLEDTSDWDAGALTRRFHGAGGG